MQGAGVPKSKKPEVSPPKPGTNRFTVQQLHEATNPKFAVFKRSFDGGGARFATLHETESKALQVAREHAAQQAGGGCLDFTFYVTEIKHRVGIERGRLVDEPMA